MLHNYLEPASILLERRDIGYLTGISNPRIKGESIEETINSSFVINATIVHNSLDYSLLQISRLD